MQIIEIEYILRNRNHELIKNDNSNNSTHEQAIKDYNYTQYEIMNPQDEKLTFKDVGLNGQESHPDFTGKYILISKSEGRLPDCKTNLSQKVIDALSLENICSELYIE